MRLEHPGTGRRRAPRVYTRVATANGGSTVARPTKCLRSRVVLYVRDRPTKVASKRRRLSHTCYFSPELRPYTSHCPCEFVSASNVPRQRRRAICSAFNGSSTTGRTSSTAIASTRSRSNTSAPRRSPSPAATHRSSTTIPSSGSASCTPTTVPCSPGRSMPPGAAIRRSSVARCYCAGFTATGGSCGPSTSVCRCSTSTGAGWRSRGWRATSPIASKRTAVLRTANRCCDCSRKTRAT